MSFLDGLFTGGSGAIVVQDESANVGDTARAKLNFKGNLVTAVDNPTADAVDVTISTEGLATMLDVREEGVTAGYRGALNFISPLVTAVDNPLEECVDVMVEAPPLHMPFTLRKVSTNVTIAEEIGVLRFDDQAYPGASITLIAEMDVALAGQVATLELRSLLTGSLIATLTTSALVTTKRSVELNLSAGEVLYSARLSRTGGTENDLVSCRAVGLEIVWQTGTS